MSYKGGEASSVPGPGLVPILRANNISGGALQFDDLIYVPDSRVSPQQLVRKHDIVLAMSSGSRDVVGKAALSDNDWPGGFGAFCGVLRVREGVQAEYLARFLASADYRRQIDSVATGTNINNLNRDTLSQVALPLAPLSLQRQISEHLGMVDMKRASALRYLHLVRRALGLFRQSILAAACSGRLTRGWRADHSEVAPRLGGGNAKRSKKLRALVASDLDEIPSAWAWTQVDNVLPPGGLFDGPFGSNLKSSDYTNSGARVIRLENIGHLRFLGEKRTYVSRAKYDELAKHAVRPGDVVFSSFVQEQIRVCVLPDDLDPDALAKADCFTLRPVPAVDARYLTLQLASPRTFRQLRGDIHGATRPRVNTEQVRALPLPVCSLAEQREIVRRVDQLLASADAISNRIDSAWRTTEATGRALLTVALGGGANTPTES